MVRLQQERYEQKQSYLDRYKMVKKITELKNDPDHVWLGDVSRHSLQLVCFDLNKAYQRFFKKRSNYPRFKHKGRYNESFPVSNDRFFFKNNRVFVMKVGYIQYKADYSDIDFEQIDKFYNPRIKFDNGKWILSFAMYIDVEPLQNKKGSIGIDLGIRKLATCSFSEIDEPIVFANLNKTNKLKQLRHKEKHIQRVISRKYEAGNRVHPEQKWQKTNAIRKYEKLLARIRRKLANIRLDQRHKATTALVKLAPERIIIEDLNVHGMLKNQYRAKAIGEMSWYAFRKMLEYKCANVEIDLVFAYRFYPSSKTCCKCGFVHKGLKQDDYVYKCPHCGNIIDRDYNAAINLMNYNSSK